jgi:hypothetical protein
MTYNYNPKSLLNLRTPPKGVHYSIATEFKKGQPSPLKGKKNPKGSLAKMGKNNPLYGKKPWNKGVKGLQCSKFRGLKRPEFSKEKHWNWKGGITRERESDMHSLEYKKWRSDVFTRDNWTCQTCGIRGVKLHAHHIKKWSQYKELRYVVENGVTLCESCHRLTHKKYANLPTS